jgi:hypothetical protein
VPFADSHVKTLIALVFFVTSAAFATQPELLPWDREPWTFPEPKGGLVAIGDIHGDPLALEIILRR